MAITAGNAFLKANDVSDEEIAQIQATTQSSTPASTSDAPQTAHEFIDEKFNQPFSWADYTMQNILSDMVYWGELNGHDKYAMGQQWESHGHNMLKWMESHLFRSADRDLQNSPHIIRQEIALGDSSAEEFKTQGMGRDWYFQTLEGQQSMLDQARQWMSSALGYQLERAPATPGGGGGGGRGSRGPSAEDIRKQFDIKELTNSVNEMSRGLVLDEHGNAAGVARAYVDAIVKTKGETKIDFQTFVRDKLEQTARYKSIYKNKPSGLSAEEYIQPYYRSALGITGNNAEGEAESIAVAGAQFGASGEQFDARLRRTDQFQASAPFITNLEGRLGELNSIFKG